MSDFLYIVLWVTVYSIPSFLLQLFLFFKVKNKFIRRLPVLLFFAGMVLVVDMFFNFSGIHSGWHELGAFFIGCYVGIFAVGIINAFVVYKLYCHKKK